MLGEARAIIQSQAKHDGEQSVQRTRTVVKLADHEAVQERAKAAESQVVKLQKEVERLKTENETLKQQVATLKGQVAELRRAWREPTLSN